MEKRNADRKENSAALIAKINSPETRARLAAVSTKYLTPERMLRMLGSAMSRTPGLMDCSFVSIINSVMSAHKLGIEIDGRHAHIIPYKTEAKLIIDWKGYVLLGRRNGVTGIQTGIVHENDEFDYVITQAGVAVTHRPKLRGERGEPLGAYCIYAIDGATSMEWMSMHDIELVRSRSAASGDGPWVTDYLEMARKCPVRRASKYWPFSDTSVEDLSTADFDSNQMVNVTAPQGAIGSSMMAAMEPAAPETVQSTPAPKPSARRIKAEAIASKAEEPENRVAKLEQAVMDGAPSLGPWGLLLEAELKSAGFTFSDLMNAQANGQIVRGVDLSSCADAYDIPDSLCGRLMNSRIAVLTSISAFLNAQKQDVNE